MGTIERLHGKIVFVDTAPFIYHIEEAGDYRETLHEFFAALDDGHIRAVTSVVTIMEVLVKPYRLQLNDLVTRFENAILDKMFLEVVGINLEIAKFAARIRAGNKVALADAIQLASADYFNAAFFLTNDKRIRQVTNTKIVCLDDLVSGDFLEGMVGIIGSIVSGITIANKYLLGG